MSSRQLESVLKAVEQMPHQERLAVVLKCLDVDVARLRAAWPHASERRQGHLHTAAKALLEVKGMVHRRSDQAARLLGDLP